MEGLELEEGSCNLYRELDHQNAIQAMIAVLAIDTFNASFSAFADGNMRNIPPNERDINLKNGIKAAMASATLLEKFQEMQYGSQKSLLRQAVRRSLAMFNLADGAGAKPGPMSQNLSPHEEKRSGKSGSGKVVDA